MPITAAFGEWEPAFFGVTLQFSGPRQWQRYQRLLGKEVGQTESLSDDERFETLAVESATSHEVRHFHDGLLSSYCAHVALQRINMLQNALQILSCLTAEGYEVLPVPLGAWCRKSIETRELWLSGNARNVVGRVIPLPYIGALTPARRGPLPKNLDGLAKLILACQQADNNIEQIVTYTRYSFPDGTRFQPWHVMEIAAINIQLEEISRLHGWKETQFFLRYVQQSQSTYTKILALNPSLLGDVGDSGTVLAMATWSMLGSYKEDENYAMPSERLNRLTACAREGRISLIGAEIPDLFEQWSQRTGLSRVESGVQEATLTYQRIAANLEKFPDETLARVGTGLRQASDHMTDWFLKNQGRYAKPSSYLDACAEIPSPSVRIVFDGHGLPLEQNQGILEAEGWSFPWIVETQNGPAATTILTPLSASAFSFMSIEDANDTADLVDAARFILSERGRSQVRLKRFGDLFFARKGIHPIEVF